MRSRLVAQSMPFSSAHNTESIFSQQKRPYFNVLPQNGVVLYNSNKNLDKKCLRHREPETEAYKALAWLTRPLLGS